MTIRDTERRLAALEQKQAGPQKIAVVYMTYDHSHRELTKEEAEERLAAAHAEVGPNGIVIKVVHGDWPRMTVPAAQDVPQ